MEQNKPKPFTTAGAFYLDLSLLRPGDKIVLRVRDGQGQARDVELVLGQGGTSENRCSACS